MHALKRDRQRQRDRKREITRQGDGHAAIPSLLSSQDLGHARTCAWREFNPLGPGLKLHRSPATQPLRQLLVPTAHTFKHPSSEGLSNSVELLGWGDCIYIEATTKKQNNYFGQTILIKEFLGQSMLFPREL